MSSTHLITKTKMEFRAELCKMSATAEISFLLSIVHPVCSTGVPSRASNRTIILGNRIKTLYARRGNLINNSIFTYVYHVLSHVVMIYVHFIIY